MEDGEIVALYWERSEAAISETLEKYGRYCNQIAYNILRNAQDAEECVSETCLRAWNAMPPQRPCRLSSFLGKITRNLSLNRYERYAAQKRGSGQGELVLSELEECIPSGATVEEASEEMALTQALNSFLAALPKLNRTVFVRRYWYLCSIQEIAAQYGMKESKVTSMLFRARNRLRLHLEKEGIVL